MAALKSPRPAPKFFMDTQSFSTKKERGTPREQPPPRPPMKSAPPMSRFGPLLKQEQRAQAVSFRASDSSLRSQHYNETSPELYFDQCFIIESKLGAGSFGDVFKVKSKEDGKHYAVKRSRERFRGERDRKRKLEEVAKHEQLPKHSNCIQFIKAWEERQHLYIQTELCEMSLSNYCESQHDIPETLIWNYLVDLLQAVKHLHNHDLIHLDIKPANIFITRDGVCKLGDFGLVFDLKKTDPSEPMEGDPMYLAPELLEGKFTKAADVFSLGISILELACDLDLPSGGKNWHQLRKGEFPESLNLNISEDLAIVIKLMMYPNYALRPSVDSLLKLPVIDRVLQKRNKDLRMNVVLVRLRDSLHRFSSYIGMFWTLLTFPLFRIYKQIVSASRENVDTSCSSSFPISKRHPSEWDYSFSDDDVSDDSAFLPDLSFSNDIHNYSFLESNEPLRNSTPTVKYSSECRARTPSVFPKHDWDSYRFSPSENSVMFEPSPRQTPQRCSGNSFSNKIDFSRSIIEPKNLTKVFDAIASDESD